MQDNTELRLAEQYLQFTDKNIFLTGKAGTGKTTFLKNLKHKLSKRFIVVAPTGVAALQAGGVTIHSFFQLPFHLYIPGTKPQTRKFSKQKINLIRSLDLIVIDEISMVRCDVMDQIDYILRHIRYNSYNKPFGGVQMLMIGDLNQLPPVVSETEAEQLSEYYPNFYFFSSLALTQSDYKTITLKHIYRQSDLNFISVLNSVRENNISPQVIQTLNRCYVPDILNNIPDGYIVLCTHNTQADAINAEKLDALQSKPKIYQAEVDGDFPQNIFPTAEQLLIKKGEQVMFLKNDYSAGEGRKKRYYNGKIGTVERCEDDYIVVSSPGEDDIFVEKYTWENVKYTLDAKTKAITEEITGTFRQFPLRAAWAVTIHKSQGLTFDKVIINSNRAFSHGQVYVALSRCRTLEGIILTEQFASSSVISDMQVRQFTDEQQLNAPTEQSFNIAKQQYFIENIISVFDFSLLTRHITHLSNYLKEILSKVFPKKSERNIVLCEQYNTEIHLVAQKFIRFITSTAAADNSAEEINTTILQRSLKARDYFLDKLCCIDEIILDLVDTELDNSDDNDELNQLIIDIAIEKEIKHRLLNFVSIDFSSQTYIKLRNSILAEGNSLELKSIKAEKKKRNEEQKAENTELFNILRQWRKEKAEQLQVPAYCVISQKALIAVSSEMPKSPRDMLKLKGVGKKTVEKYADEILQIIANYCGE